MYEVGSVKTSNSPGKCDDKVDNLVSAVELLTKQVSTPQSEMKNIKGDGHKTDVNSDFNSGDRRGRNVISCKNCKNNNRTIVAIVLNVARLTIWQGNVANHDQAIRKSERDCWYWATSNQRGFAKKYYNCKKLLSEKCYSCSSRNYVYFCGRESQLRSWTHHRTICTSIATLLGQHKEKTLKSG